jgi:hypothetical protein
MRDESIREKYENKAKLYVEIGQLAEAIEDLRQRQLSSINKAHNLQADIDRLEKIELKAVEPVNN